MFIKNGDPEKIINIIKSSDDLDEETKKKLKLAKEQAENLKKNSNNQESN